MIILICIAYYTILGVIYELLVPKKNYEKLINGKINNNILGCINLKKFNISIIGILVLVIFASGCTNSSNNSTMSNSSSSNGQSNQSGQAASSTGTPVVKVSYSGPWTGNIDDTSGGRSLQGSGSQTFQLKTPGVVSAVFQKNDPTTNSTGTLTVQIVDGSGNIVATQSTSANAGVASVSHTFS